MSADVDLPSSPRPCYGGETVASQAASMRIDLHISLPEASAMTGSVVLVVRSSNRVDGSIDVIDRIDGFAWCLYGILMGRMSSKIGFAVKKMGGKRF